MTKQNFVICVDIDDTIENLSEAWVEWLNKKYNLDVCVNEMTSWGIEKYFPMLTKFQLFEPLYDDRFWYTVKPKKDAIKYLKHLYDEGFSVYLLTSTHYAQCKSKMEAIVERYFNFIDWHHIITCTNKQMIKCDILVDDAPHNILGGEYTPILFDANHNRDFDNKLNNIIRVKSWKSAYNNIEKIYNNRKEN